MNQCKSCRISFEPARPMQTACGLACAVKVAVASRLKRAQVDAKADRVETRKRREAIKPRAQWLAEAQVAFNAWIRVRDPHLACISCGTREGKVNAGHYLSVGARPELRFEPLNVHRQCERCNTYLHGNLVAYRVALVGRIGLQQVEWLEGSHVPKKYTIDDLRTMAAQWRAQTREALK